MLWSGMFTLFFSFTSILLSKNADEVLSLFTLSAMQMPCVPSVPAASQIEGVENREGGGLAELHLN